MENEFFCRDLAEKIMLIHQNPPRSTTTHQSIPPSSNFPSSSIRLIHHHHLLLHFFFFFQKKISFLFFSSVNQSALSPRMVRSRMTLSRLLELRERRCLPCLPARSASPSTVPLTTLEPRRTRPSCSLLTRPASWVVLESVRGLRSPDSVSGGPSRPVRPETAPSVDSTLCANHCPARTWRRILEQVTIFLLHLSPGLWLVQ